LIAVLITYGFSAEPPEQVDAALRAKAGWRDTRIHPALASSPVASPARKTILSPEQQFAHIADDLIKQNSSLKKKKHAEASIEQALDGFLKHDSMLKDFIGGGTSQAAGPPTPSPTKRVPEPSLMDDLDNKTKTSIRDAAQHMSDSQSKEVKRQLIGIEKDVQDAEKLLTRHKGHTEKKAASNALKIAALAQDLVSATGKQSQAKAKRTPFKHKAAPPGAYSRESPKLTETITAASVAQAAAAVARSQQAPKPIAKAKPPVTTKTVSKVAASKPSEKSPQKQSTFSLVMGICLSASLAIGVVAVAVVYANSITNKGHWGQWYGQSSYDVVPQDAEDQSHCVETLKKRDSVEAPDYSVTHISSTPTHRRPVT